MLNEYVVMDMEMTGLSSHKDKIIEIGAVKVFNGQVVEEFQTLVNPNIKIEEKITDITGISMKMVQDKPHIEEVLQDFVRFLGESIIIGHNLVYDYSFLMQAFYNNDMKEQFKRKWYGIDTLKIARKKLDNDEEKTLGALCRKYNIYDEKHHRALNDAYMTMKLYKIFCEEFESDTEKFKEEEYFYKPKKERKPSKKEIEYVEKLMDKLSISPQVDIYKMTQSELNRYADYIRLNQYSLSDRQ